MNQSSIACFLFFFVNKGKLFSYALLQRAYHGEARIVNHSSMWLEWVGRGNLNRLVRNGETIHDSWLDHDDRTVIIERSQQSKKKHHWHHELTREWNSVHWLWMRDVYMLRQTKRSGRIKKSSYESKNESISCVFISPKNDRLKLVTEMAIYYKMYCQTLNVRCLHHEKQYLLHQLFALIPILFSRCGANRKNVWNGSMKKLDIDPSFVWLNRVLSISWMKLHFWQHPYVSLLPMIAIIDDSSYPFLKVHYCCCHCCYGSRIVLISLCTFLSLVNWPWKRLNVFSFDYVSLHDLKIK
jgi:hypothetical protein